MNVEIQSYGNQVILMGLPPHMAAHKKLQGGNTASICVDACLEREILLLWSLGITTIGCCCGHNKMDPQIGVADKDIMRMILMGYRTWPTHNNHFYPKSV